jgi:hypothetical protein
MTTPSAIKRGPADGARRHLAPDEQKRSDGSYQRPRVSGLLVASYCAAILAFAFEYFESPQLEARLESRSVSALPNLPSFTGSNGSEMTGREISAAKGLIPDGAALFLRRDLWEAEETREPSQSGADHAPVFAWELILNMLVVRQDRKA